MKTDPMYKVESSLENCPVLGLTLFGEDIELALTDWQAWPPSPADGIFDSDLEVTGMWWKYHDLYPWQLVHRAAVTSLSMDRSLQPKFTEAVDDWIRNKMGEI